jgi:hypothetical protein
MKITTKRYAFLPKDSPVTPVQLQTEIGAAHLQIFASREGWEKFGYTFVCQADVTVEIPDVRELVENKIAALREEAAAARAAATAKCTEIESQIQNLLAIEYTPTSLDQSEVDGIAKQLNEAAEQQ